MKLFWWLLYLIPLHCHFKVTVGKEWLASGLQPCSNRSICLVDDIMRNAKRLVSFLRANKNFLTVIKSSTSKAQLVFHFLSLTKINGTSFPSHSVSHKGPLYMLHQPSIILFQWSLTNCQSLCSSLVHVLVQVLGTYLPSRLQEQNVAQDQFLSGIL